MENQLIDTNPALRLNKILLRAKESPVRDANQEQILYKNAWCQIFNIRDPNSDAAIVTVIHMLLELRKLFDETIFRLKAKEGLNEALFISPLIHMKGFIGDLNYLNHIYEQYRSQYLSEKNMTSLAFVVDTLSQSPGLLEKEIPETEIDSIAEEVSDLYEQILNSALPEDLKNNILDLLREVRLAIQEYQIRGAVRIKEVIAKSIGVLAMNKEAIMENKETPEIKNLSTILTKLDETYSRATKAQLFLQSASSIIPALIGK